MTLRSLRNFLNVIKLVHDGVEVGSQDDMYHSNYSHDYYSIEIFEKIMELKYKFKKPKTNAEWQSSACSNFLFLGYF